MQSAAGILPHNFWVFRKSAFSPSPTNPPEPACAHGKRDRSLHSHISNAAVTLTKTDTAATQSTTANAAGAYVFPSLQTGLYEIAVSA